MRSIDRRTRYGRRAIWIFLLAAALACISPFGASKAAAKQIRACYEVFDADSGAPIDVFINVVLQPSGTLNRSQSVYAMHGRFTAHEDDRADPAPATMSLLTGTVLVADGEGAQMSMLHNFGRGIPGGIRGFAALDCGSKIDRPGARAWICRGVVADQRTSDVLNAREIRLRRVKSRKTPQCQSVLIDPN